MSLSKTCWGCVPVLVVRSVLSAPSSRLLEVRQPSSPVSKQPLDFVSEVEDGSGARYYAIYLTPQLSNGSMVMVSDIWGHYHSRIIDDFELISAWAARH